MIISLKDFLLTAKEHKYFLISLIIVIIISAVSTHSDFVVLSNVADKITSANFDIYNKKSIIIMPPLIYFVDTINLILFKAVKIVNFSISTISSPTQLQIFALKMRYVLIFILSYFLVTKTAKAYTSNNFDVKLIANLWITSPILLLLTFAQGNNDIYPAFFSLLFLYFAFNKQNIWALICLGLVAALKNYALILVPFVTLILAEKDYKKTFLYGLIVLVIYLIPSLFYLHHLGHFFSANGEGIMILQPKISSGPNYYIFIILYSSSLLHLIFSDNTIAIKNQKNELLVSWCFLILSLCFMFSFFLPQWFLWLVPFMVFSSYKNMKLFHLSLLIYFVFFGITAILFPNNLDLSLFKPIAPMWVSNYLIKLATPNSPFMHLSGGLYSVFASLLIMFNYFQFKENNKSNEPLDSVIVKYNYLPLLGYFLLIFFVVYISIVIL